MNFSNKAARARDHAAELAFSGVLDSGLGFKLLDLLNKSSGLCYIEIKIISSKNMFCYLSFEILSIVLLNMV